MNVAVFGVGYVGSVTAAGLASLGHQVAVFDTDAAKARSLVAGTLEIHEPGLAELISGAAGRLRVADSDADAVRGSSVVLICVPTPSAADGSIDLGYVDRATVAVAEAAGTEALTVVIRSTVVPGTTERLDRELLAPLRARGKPVSIAVNPEFLREGRAVADFTRTDRVVAGASDERARAAIRELYATMAAPIMFMSPSSAELAKYVSNALLATLVSFSNEMADLAERIESADVIDALGALHADRRWTETEGPWRPAILSYLWPGCGYGGSCLPKDTKALLARGRQLGLDLPLLAATDAINGARAGQLLDRVDEAQPIRGSRVAVLGTAFKEGTGDQRDSPGLKIADEIRRRGGEPIEYDPILDAGSDARLDAVLARARIWIVTTGAAAFEGLGERASQAGTLLVDARRRFTRPTKSGYIGPGVAR